MSKDVDEWFEKATNPQKQLMQMVREVFLQSDSRISECIKWQAPTFVYKGNLATFQPRAKKFVSVMFHRGAEIPGDHKCLEGEGKLARTMRFKDLKELELTKHQLEAVVVAWCDSKDVAGL